MAKPCFASSISSKEYDPSIPQVRWKIVNFKHLSHNGFIMDIYKFSFSVWFSWKIIRYFSRNSFQLILFSLVQGHHDYIPKLCVSFTSWRHLNFQFTNWWHLSFDFFSLRLFIVLFFPHSFLKTSKWFVLL